MKEKFFIQYGMNAPVAIEKVKTFKRTGGNIEFFFDSGVVTWQFGTVAEAEYAHNILIKTYVYKMDTLLQKEAKETMKKLKVEDSNENEPKPDML
jgi:hypothetical protein